MQSLTPALCTMIVNDFSCQFLAMSDWFGQVERSGRRAHDDFHVEPGSEIEPFDLRFKTV